MTSQEYTEQAALALAPSFRERFDFTHDDHPKLFAELTWKVAKALSAKRDSELPKLPERKEEPLKIQWSKNPPAAPDLYIGEHQVGDIATAPAAERPEQPSLINRIKAKVGKKGGST